MSTSAHSRNDNDQHLHGFIQLFDAHPCPSLLVEPQNGRILDGNFQALQLYGATREDLTQKKVQDLLATPAESGASSFPYTKGASVETHRKEDGTEIRVEVTTIAINVQGKLGLLYVIHDLTLQWAREREWKERLDHLQHLANHDHLTGLPNRLLCQERLEYSIAMAQRLDYQLAVLFIDIDNFKQINDSLGHQAGDEVLCEVSRRLRSELRKGDTLARVGGDEFLIILERVQALEEVEEILQRLRHSLLEPITLAGQRIQVTLSIGCSLYPTHAENASQLMGQSDRALLRAKECGKDSYCFYA